jgi:hypothetical protein
MGSISSGHYSTDIQAMDALRYLWLAHPPAAAQIMRDFPEMGDPKWEGSWLDTDAMGVDVEYGSWLVDAIEATGHVYWEEGEPWTADTPRADEEEGISDSTPQACILTGGTWWPTWLAKDEARRMGYIYRDPDGNEYR